MKGSQLTKLETLSPAPVSRPAATLRGHCLAFRRAVRVALLGALASCLAGCYSHTLALNKVIVAPGVHDATLEELNTRLASQYAVVKTLTLKVNIQVSTGGTHEGESKVYLTVPGYILVRKPADLLVLLQAPVAGNMLLQMVANGTTFKLLSPPKNIAREGSETVSSPDAKGLESLRPSIIRDALEVPPVGKGESVSRTLGSRILPAAPGKKEAVEEPDYDLTVTRPKQGNELETVRVVHISRVTLKPYEQDVYDRAGNIVEKVIYDNYQKTGDLDFPHSILITIPAAEYTMKIEVTKVTLNQDMDDEQFKLEFPPNMTVQKMN